MEEQRKRGGGMLASFADALSTHPPSRERVAQMNEMSSSSSRTGKISSASFDRIRSKAKTISKKKGAKI